MEQLGNTSRRRFLRASSMLGVGTALGEGIVGRVLWRDRRPDAGRCPRSLHAVLADHYGCIRSALSLGLQRLSEEGLLRREGCNSSSRRERISGRDLHSSAQLGRKSLPQAHSLQKASQGRALRRMGAAGLLL